jgi:hypothetical protein
MKMNIKYSKKLLYLLDKIIGKFLYIQINIIIVEDDQDA